MVAQEMINFAVENRKQSFKFSIYETESNGEQRKQEHDR